MNALEGCIDFTNISFFFLFFYGCQVEGFSLLGLSLIVVSTACEQKAGEYLIADILAQPVFKPFSRSGLLFKRQGTPGDSSALIFL